MSKTTKVKMLDTVEDSNVFRPDELEGVPPNPYTLAVTERKEGDFLISVTRVDKIPVDAEVELPTRQATQLVNLGLAEVVTA